jgi:hypothetical protein
VEFLATRYALAHDWGLDDVLGLRVQAGGYP